MTQASHLRAGPHVPDALRVVVVDDQELLSRGLRLLLDQEPDIEVVGEACDGPAALHLVGQHLPDVVLLDLHTPSWDSGELCRRIKALAPATRIVALTDVHDQSVAVQVVGADGQVGKDSPIEDVAGAVRLVAKSRAA
ncbi:response regulator [Actinopolymorpha alba]|uniref:response regulator n=1 Tax=Actinopolymorpha alba TaxID=533267 RepID=UPI00037E3EF8|nr:response regulator transcription factor [Actinopolymorpha alba]